PDQLPLQGIATVFGLTELELSLLELPRHGADLGHVVLSAITEQAHVAQAELLHAVLGLRELLLVATNLLFDEAPRGIRILALADQAGFDKERQQRLHDALGTLGPGVRIRQREKIAALRRTDPEIPGKT